MSAPRRAVVARPDPRRFVALRLETLARTPGFVGGPRAAGQLASFWARGERLGLAHHHRDDLQALWFRDPATWFGGVATLLMLDRDPRSPDALAHLLAIVRAHLDDPLDDTTFVEVDARDLALVHGLVELGFHLDAVVQVGDPRVALGALVARYDPPLALSSYAPALALEPARPGDVDGIVALHRATFSARPELCFYGASPRHLARMHDHIAVLVALGGDPVEHWVVRAPDGRVAGHLELEVDRDHPFWGAYAGLGVILEPALQGRGIVKSLYRVALAAAVARGARLVKGGTAQPAVLGLGRLMGRPWHTISLRRVGVLPPEHFLRFHPDGQDHGQSDR